MSGQNAKPAGITHEPDQSRFTDAYGSVLDYRLEAGGALVVTHVKVPEHLRGQGVAPSLMQALLAYADREGLAVTAECSYAALYLRRAQR